MRRAHRVRKRPMLGVERTYGGHHEIDAFDPNRTWRTRLLDHLVGAGDYRQSSSTNMSDRL
jgi:hypothetical protein